MFTCVRGTNEALHMYLLYFYLYVVGFYTDTIKKYLILAAELLKVAMMCM